MIDVIGYLFVGFIIFIIVFGVWSQWDLNRYIRRQCYLYIKTTAIYYGLGGLKREYVITTYKSHNLDQILNDGFVLDSSSENQKRARG